MPLRPDPRPASRISESLGTSLGVLALFDEENEVNWDFYNYL